MAQYVHLMNDDEIIIKRAFPDVPLRTLLEAGAWHRVSGGGMTDEEFDALLGPSLNQSTTPDR